MRNNVNKKKRKIGVVTVGRSDWSIWAPILKGIKQSAHLELILYATGMHLSPEFGYTVSDIFKDGFKVDHFVEITISSDSPQGVTKAVGLGVISFSQIFDKNRPDVLFVLGDRFETLSAVLAALPYKIPIVHLHGGESTEGLIDESIRHSITKMSHIHFVATDAYARRIIQMGESPDRVFLSGAPALDTIKKLDLFSLKELEREFKIHLPKPPILVTFHPVTLEFEKAERQVAQIMTAIKRYDLPVVFTLSNADPKGRKVMEVIRAHISECSMGYILNNLGTKAYFSFLAHSSLMLGNSSSGIIEAASFKLPVVNVGIRQRGRIHGKNVIDVGDSSKEIRKGMDLALSFSFKKSLSNLKNPYGNGGAAKKIIKKLEKISFNDEILLKEFHDLKYHNL